LFLLNLLIKGIFISIDSERDGKMAIVIIVAVVGIIALVFRNSFKEEKACCSNYKAKDFSMTGICRVDESNMKNEEDDEG